MGPLFNLGLASHVSVAIDGADDVDDELNLVKGGGGALLREKMVEVCASKFIVIVDESKIGSGLGPAFPVPVEITPFCHGHTMRKV
jgi:ribose 5-phosphate isomerase A